MSKFIHTLPCLIRSVQRLPSYRRFDHISSLFKCYNGEDWQEHFRHHPSETVLFESDEERYQIALFTQQMNAPPQRVTLLDNRRYMMRALHGNAKLVTPKKHYEYYLFPSDAVKEYWTWHRSHIEFENVCAMLIFAQQFK